MNKKRLKLYLQNEAMQFWCSSNAHALHVGRPRTIEFLEAFDDHITFWMKTKFKLKPAKNLRKACLQQFISFYREEASAEEILQLEIYLMEQDAGP